MTVKLYQIEIPHTSQTNWCDGKDLLPAMWQIRHLEDWDAYERFVGKIILSAVREVMRTQFYEMDGIPTVREVRFLDTPNKYGHRWFITICYNQKRGYLATYGGKGGDDERIHWSIYMD